MSKRVLALALFWFCACGAAAPEAPVVTGRVFLDANADGVLSPGEQGLDGVAVTDGLTTVVTAGGGAFRIVLGDDPVLSDGGLRIVSVCVPNGHRPTTPWFARIEGAPAEADFGLAPEVQALPFVFVHGTDPHVPRGGEHQFVRFRRELAALGDALSFCILTGDLIHLGDNQGEEEVKRQLGLLEAGLAGFPLPLRCTPGNHDIVGVRAPKLWDKTHPLYGYGAYTRLVGPFRWSFDYAGIHFAGLDFNKVAGGEWSWGVPESAVAWLDGDLALVPPGRRIFVFVHFPSGVDALQKVLQKHKVAQVFHGHDHTDFAHARGGVPCLSSGSIGQIFKDSDRATGYRLVRVDAEGIDTFYRELGAEHAITVEAPRHNTDLAGEVRGAFFDPAGAVRALSVSIGDLTESVAFERGPLWSRFSFAPGTPLAPGANLPVTVELTTDSAVHWFRHHYKTAAEEPLVANGAFKDGKDGALPAPWFELTPAWAGARCAFRSVERGLLVEAPGNPFAIGRVAQKISRIAGGRAYAVTAACTPQNLADLRSSALVRVVWTKGGEALHPAGVLVRGPRAAAGLARFEDVLLAPPGADGAELSLELKWPRGGSIVWHEAGMRPVPAPARRAVKAGTVFLRPSRSTPEKNLALFCAQIDAAGAEGLDIVCLGEAIALVGTGKSVDAVAEPIPGPSTEKLGEAARRNRVWVVAGLNERRGGTLFNTAVLLDRAGALAGVYRKVHLPREEWTQGVAPGNEFPVFETELGAIGIQICYDWFFPEAAACLALKGAEIIFAPTWGTTFPDKDGCVEGETVFRVRARDNGGFLIPSVYDGDSLVIDRRGRILASTGGREGLAWAELDLSAREPLPWVGEWRELGPRHRVPEAYGPLLEGAAAAVR